MKITPKNFNISLTMTKIRYHRRCEGRLAASVVTSALSVNNRESGSILGHKTKDCGLAFLQAA